MTAFTSWEWWRWRELTVSGEVSCHCCTAFVTCGLVVWPLKLDNTQVFLCFPYGGRLLFLWTICCPKESCAVLVTLPTEVRHWLHDHHWRNKHLPQLTKGGVSYSVDRVVFFSNSMIDSPDLSLQCTGWQELYVCATVPWHPFWQEQAILLSVIEQETHNVLNGWEREWWGFILDAWC